MEKPDLISVPGESCPYVSNDHPPLCQQPSGTKCLKCPEYLDGICDLIPWDKETMTADQKALLKLYKKRGELYASMNPIYQEIHYLANIIEAMLKRVRKAQGR